MDRYLAVLAAIMMMERVTSVARGSPPWSGSR